MIDRPKPEVAKAPLDIHDKTDLIGRVLLNLVPLIVQTDSSRVISIVIQHNHGMPQINGVNPNTTTSNPTGSQAYRTIA